MLSMDNKTIRNFLAPSTSKLATAPTIITRDVNFELKLALIMMVQGSPFFGKAHEDANAHLQHFLEICGRFTIKGVTQEAIWLCLFWFSLINKALPNSFY